MLSFLKKIFGAKPSESTVAPYKVEGTEHFPFPKTVKEEKPTATAQKPAVKKPAVKKPRAPKSPKA